MQDAEYENFFSDSDTESEEDLDMLLEKVRAMEPMRAIAPKSSSIKKKSGSVYEAQNILDDEVIEEFLMPISDECNSLLTPLETTTITLGGEIEGVTFMEEDLIKQIVATESCWHIKCNYGEVSHPSYYEFLERKARSLPVKGKRGRKKKERKKKERKVQGNGSCFNSQVGFHLPTNDGLDQWKIKVFRNGVIQTPGAKPENLREVIQKCFDILPVLAPALGVDPVPELEIHKLNPFMKNYKCEVIKKDEQYLDLFALKYILTYVKLTDEGKIITDADVPGMIPNSFQYTPIDDILPKFDHLLIDGYPNFMPHPMIFDIKYTREDSKLCVKFLTPIHGKAQKMVRVNFFMKGKMNILGAYEELFTRQIYEFFIDIFEKFRKELIVAMGPSDTDYVILHTVDNYASTEPNITEILSRMPPKKITYPEIPPDEWAEFVEHFKQSLDMI